MRHIVSVSVTAVLFLAIGCGGSDSSSLTGTNNNGNVSGPMSASLDGKAWASPAPGAVYSGNILSVAGIDLGITASVGFVTGGVTGPGTYSLSFGNQLAGHGTVT